MRIRDLAIRFCVTTLVIFTASGAGAQEPEEPITLLGAACDGGLDQPVTEPGTGRTFVLDYPCELLPDQTVTFILNLHGGGSNTRYQHGYFPAHDFKDAYRLVVATPYSPIARWTEDDDAYLQNIVSMVVDAVGPKNVRAFWLAGHSQGGSTSRRLVCTEFFAPRVDGLLSLSGGRLGGSPERAPDAGRPRQADDPPSVPASTPAAPRPEVEQPACDFSHIFATGEHEIVDLPATSSWATRYQCQARMQLPDVTDTVAGYVHDSGHQNPATAAWGRLPRGGVSQLFEYPYCNNGRVVADVVRVDKGHTEGLEPNVMEAIVKLMVSAYGSKIQQAATR